VRLPAFASISAIERPASPDRRSSYSCSSSAPTTRNLAAWASQ
jgi:hypothetical protein